MSIGNPKARRSARLRATFAALACNAALLATSVEASSTPEAGSDAGALVGTWAVQVTLRDCATNAPQGSFNSLVTFHRGGTISESAASLTFAAGQRTAAQGTWNLKQGDDTYRQRMIALILFDTAANLPGTPTFDPSRPVSPGFRAGWSTVRHAIAVDGDHLTSEGANAFFDATGAAYRTGCSTAVGERFK